MAVPVAPVGRPAPPNRCGAVPFSWTQTKGRTKWVMRHVSACCWEQPPACSPSSSTGSWKSSRIRGLAYHTLSRRSGRRGGVQARAPICCHSRCRAGLHPVGRLFLALSIPGSFSLFVKLSSGERLAARSCQGLNTIRYSAPISRMLKTAVPMPILRDNPSISANCGGRPGGAMGGVCASSIKEAR